MSCPIDVPLPENPLDFFLASLPRSLAALAHPKTRGPMKRSRLRIASVQAYEDATYCQALARWRERGGRLGYCQHGGNYGQVKVACDVSLVEYAQDVFFTWGWSRHGEEKGNFVPMPYPQLARIGNAWSQRSNEFIFVGTEMCAFGHRLDSQPTPLQMVSYRQDKLRFLENLPLPLLEHISYRPYFDVPGSLQDWELIHRRFRQVRLCQGSLLPQLLGCSMLILDHPGTTMLEAFAANIPMLLYWDRQAWPMTDEANAAIDCLANCGIWRANPSEAARALTDVAADSASWWNAESIQKARQNFCEQFARLPVSSLAATWIKTLYRQ